MISYNKFVACMRIFLKIGCYMKCQDCGIRYNSDIVISIANHYKVTLKDKMYPISYDEGGKSHYIILAFAANNLDEFVTNVITTEEDGDIIVIICPDNSSIDKMSNDELLDSLGSIVEVVGGGHDWQGDMNKIASDIIYASLVYEAMSEAFNFDKILEEDFNNWTNRNVLGYISGRVEGFEITSDICKPMTCIDRKNYYNYDFVPALYIYRKKNDDEKSGD